MDSTKSHVGEGIYGLAEAARLTGVSARRIARWFKGYRYTTDKGSRTMRPVLNRGEAVLDGLLQLSFADLAEVRCIDRLRDLGVSWRELRVAVNHAQELFHTPHPFASNRLKTDGKRVFASLVQTGEHSSIVQLRDWQHVIASVIEPALHGFEFEHNEARRWWPLGRNRRVVIDPCRAFGRPIAATSGVPTEVLASYARATSTVEAARWYETEPAEVRAAVKFERSLAA